MDDLGIKTGFCHFCRYEVETKPYQIYEMVEGEPVLMGEIWLCDFCCMTSRADRKEKVLRHLNWGLNHILKKLTQSKAEDIKEQPLSAEETASFTMGDPFKEYGLPSDRNETANEAGMPSMLIDITSPSLEEIQKMSNSNYIISLWRSVNEEAGKLAIYIEALEKRLVELKDKEEFT